MTILGWLHNGYIKSHPPGYLLRILLLRFIRKKSPQERACVGNVKNKWLPLLDDFRTNLEIVNQIKEIELFLHTSPPLRQENSGYNI